MYTYISICCCSSALRDTTPTRDHLLPTDHARIRGADSQGFDGALSCTHLLRLDMRGDPTPSVKLGCRRLVGSRRGSIVAWYRLGVVLRRHLRQHDPVSYDSIANQDPRSSANSRHLELLVTDGCRTWHRTADSTNVPPSAPDQNHACGKIILAG